MTGGLRSPVARFTGGLSASSSVRAGFRSPVAKWMGGLCAPRSSPTPTPTVDTHDGIDPYVRKFWESKHVKHPATNKSIKTRKIINSYNAIKESGIEAAEVANAIIDFSVSTENALPDIRKIEFDRMMRDKVAFEKFLISMEILQLKMRAYQEEQDFMLLVLAAV